MGVTRDGFLRCLSEQETARVRAAPPKDVGLTRAEPVCLDFNVRATDDPPVWSVSQVLAGTVAFNVHQARAAASEWAQRTAGIKRDYNVKDIP
ncbi:MAG: antibiotic biosynthesis monooxygenase [Pseudomonadota bacterium]